MLQGTAYSFAPSANDADGHALTFSIENPPRWATFNANTGSLTGTPSPADVGQYSDIRISVSDGQSTVSLAPFQVTVTAVATGAVTLSWLPPTRNTDGTPLTNLRGYRVYWGTDRGHVPELDHPRESGTGELRRRAAHAGALVLRRDGHFRGRRRKRLLERRHDDGAVAPQAPLDLRCRARSPGRVALAAGARSYGRAQPLDPVEAHVGG